MRFNESDKTAVQNLIKALKKGEYKVDGMEVLALAEVFKWVGKIARMIDEDLEPIKSATHLPGEPKVEIQPPPKKGKKT